MFTDQIRVPLPRGGRCLAVVRTLYQLVEALAACLIQSIALSISLYLSLNLNLNLNLSQWQVIPPCMYVYISSPVGPGICFLPEEVYCR